MTEKATPKRPKKARAANKPQAKALPAQLVDNPVDHVDIVGADLRHEIFVREYLIHFNASEAARAAGYSPDSAGSIGHELLKKPEIQTRLADAASTRVRKLDITGDRILMEVARIAFVDLARAYDPEGNLLPLNRIPEDVRRAIAAVDVFEEFLGRGYDKAKIGHTKKLKLHDKLKALELLGRWKELALWKDSLEVDDPNRGGSDTFTQVMGEIRFMMTQVRAERRK